MSTKDVVSKNIFPTKTEFESFELDSDVKANDFVSHILDKSGVKHSRKIAETGTEYFTIKTNEIDENGETVKLRIRYSDHEPSNKNPTSDIDIRYKKGDTIEDIRQKINDEFYFDGEINIYDQRTKSENTEFAKGGEVKKGSEWAFWAGLLGLGILGYIGINKK